MRKLFFSLSVLLAFSATVSAQQTEFSNKKNFGVKFGLNSSKVSFTIPDGDGTFNTNSRMDLYAGILTEIPVNEVFSIQPELFFTRVGAHTMGQSNRVKYVFSYVELPILFHYIAEPYSFYLGPQLGYMIDARGYIRKDGVMYTQDINDNFKRLNPSIVLGADYTLENGLGFDVRFQLGFLSTMNNKFNNGFPGTGPDFRSEVNATQIGLTYKWMHRIARKKYNN